MVPRRAPYLLTNHSYRGLACSTGLLPSGTVNRGAKVSPRPFAFLQTLKRGKRRSYQFLGLEMTVGNNCGWFKMSRVAGQLSKNVNLLLTGTLASALAPRRGDTLQHASLPVPMVLPHQLSRPVDQPATFGLQLPTAGACLVPIFYCVSRCTTLYQGHRTSSFSRRTFRSLLPYNGSMPRLGKPVEIALWDPVFFSTPRWDVNLQACRLNR